jgi:hypothetical protein
MKVTRIYTGEDEKSHFEELDLPLNPTPRRASSDAIPAIGTGFAESDALPSLGFHPAPRRQLVTLLSGSFEIELADGSKRQFQPGDFFLADDTTGQGHIARDLAGPMRMHYVFLPDDFDATGWRK